MKEENLNRLLTKQYKIITKEPGNEKNHIIRGVIKGLEYDEKFIIKTYDDSELYFHLYSLFHSISLFFPSLTASNSRFSILPR